LPRSDWDDALAQLAAIAEPAGGVALLVGGFEELEDAILKLGTEFTHQYEMGYVRGQNRGRHEIRIDVRRDGVTARYRRAHLVD
jgi:hypothetical protein